MKLLSKVKTVSEILRTRQLFQCTKNALFSGCSSSLRANTLSGLWQNHFSMVYKIELPSSSVCQQIVWSNNFSTSGSLKEEDHVSWRTKKTQDGRNRSREIPVELSMAYLESAGYKSTYGDKKIWELYRRNIAGRKTASRTRKSCVIDGRIETGNPCPVCRDEYLVVDYRNVKLLKQFLTDYNGKVLGWETTHVCQEQYKNYRVAIEKARDYGYLDVDAEFVEYDYTKYMPKKSEDVS